MTFLLGSRTASSLPDSSSELTNNFSPQTQHAAETLPWWLNQLLAQEQDWVTKSFPHYTHLEWMKPMKSVAMPNYFLCLTLLFAYKTVKKYEKNTYQKLMKKRCDQLCRGTKHIHRSHNTNVSSARFSQAEVRVCLATSTNKSARFILEPANNQWEGP